MNETVKVTGELNIVLRDQYGNVKQEVHVPNLVVDTGKAFIAARMAGTPSIMQHMAAGVTATAPASNNTGLLSENGRAVFDQVATVTNNVIAYKATFIAGTATGALTEAGIFNSGTANSGTMLCRTVFPVINKGAADSLTINWNVTIN